MFLNRGWSQTIYHYQITSCMCSEAGSEWDKRRFMALGNLLSRRVWRSSTTNSSWLSQKTVGDGEKLLTYLNSALKVLLRTDNFPRGPKKYPFFWRVIFCQASTAKRINFELFWHITQQILIIPYRRFGTIYRSIILLETERIYQ
jgi:hypothetical protein